MGYEVPGMMVGNFPADIDMSTKATWQFAPVWVGAAANVTGMGAGGAALLAQGSVLTAPLGILQNNPAQGQNGSVMVTGITKVKAGGTWAINDPLTCVSGAVVKAVAAGGKFAFAVALESAVSGDTCSILLTPRGIQ